MSKHIFISYSKKDSDFAWKLADDLEKRGFKIWIDRAISGGEEWRQSIEGALQEAGEVIVVLSPNAVSSDWVMHEGSVAYGLGKTLYPVLMATVDKLPIWVEKFQYTDFVGLDYDTALEELVAALTPPNPLQDLLEQQVAAYREHDDQLLGETFLRLFEENRDRLTLSPEAEELLEKSKQAVAYREQREQEVADLEKQIEELVQDAADLEKQREELVQDAADLEKQVEDSKKTLRRLRWGSLIVVAIVVVAAAVSLIGAFRELKSIEARSAFAADQLARLFEQTGTVPTGGEPRALAWDGASLWVANFGDNTVQQINPVTGAVVATLPVYEGPAALAWDGASLWVANEAYSTVQLIDPEAGSVVATLLVGNAPSALAWDGASLWVANRGDSTVQQIHPKGWEEAEPTLQVGTGPAALTWDGASLWVANVGDDTVQQINPKAGAVVATLPVGDQPTALAWDGASLWVANEYDSTVQQIDPEAGAVVATLPVGVQPGALAWDGASLWVANFYDNTVQQVDPEAGAVVATLPVGDGPSALAWDGASLWVANAQADTVQQIDPHVVELIAAARRASASEGE